MLLCLGTPLCLSTLTGCSTRPANLNTRIEAPTALSAAPSAGHSRHSAIGQPNPANWNAVLPARIASQDAYALSENSEDFTRRDARLGIVSGPIGESVNYYPGPPATSLDRPFRVTLPSNAGQVIFFRPRVSTRAHWHTSFERPNHR
jgi:hypothetical protein